MSKDDPLSRFLIYLLGLTCIIFIAYNLTSHNQKINNVPEKREIELDEIVIVNGNSVVGYSTPYTLRQEVYAIVTAYTPHETCRWKEYCITAKGTGPKEGRTVACPYWIPLGTIIEIDGKTYICEDRTARWVQRRNGDTFDIFMEDYWQAREWGRQVKVVRIYK